MQVRGDQSEEMKARALRQAAVANKEKTIVHVTRENNVNKTKNVNVNITNRQNNRVGQVSQAAAASQSAAARHETFANQSSQNSSPFMSESSSEVNLQSKRVAAQNASSASVVNTSEMGGVKRGDFTTGYKLDYPDTKAAIQIDGPKDGYNASNFKEKYLNRTGLDKLEAGLGGEGGEAEGYTKTEEYVIKYNYGEGAGAGASHGSRTVAQPPSVVTKSYRNESSMNAAEMRKINDGDVKKIISTIRQEEGKRAGEEDNIFNSSSSLILSQNDLEKKFARVGQTTTTTSTSTTSVTLNKQS